jgi:hypothetical protein
VFPSASTGVTLTNSIIRGSRSPSPQPPRARARRRSRPRIPTTTRAGTRPPARTRALSKRTTRMWEMRGSWTRRAVTSICAPTRR